LTGERLSGVRAMLPDLGVDALLVTSPDNRFYLSGFTGTAGTLLIGQEKAVLFTDFRYTGQAELQAPLYSIRRYKDDYHQVLSELIKEAGWSKIGYESKNMSCFDFSRLDKKISVQFIPLEETAEKLRMIKSCEEQEIMRQGAGKIDLAFSWLLEVIKPGMSERELAVELEIFLLRQGSQRPSFDFIVASGERGALPHGVASEKLMGEGELVTIDFGAFFNGYATDMTRTVALKKIDQRQKDIYDIVYRAQCETVAAVKPGLTGKELDSIARDIITEAGFGEQFGHGLGHSIGLETHEPPALNPKNNTTLQPGMVVTVEPGIYIPGWGGVRIEDMVLVTESGAVRLTQSHRELIII
jgi:Xaa-Pro aminopeptidase